MARLGKVEQRWSYASWMAPSHFNLLMGLLPHTSPKRSLRVKYYKKRDFLKFNERFGSADFEFKSLAPKLYLPCFLQNRSEVQYTCHGFFA